MHKGCIICASCSALLWDCSLTRVLFPCASTPVVFLQDEINLREIKLKWKNKEKFVEKQVWPDRLEGSYVTYGWVLIFSTLAPVYPKFTQVDLIPLLI